MRSRQWIEVPMPDQEVVENLASRLTEKVWLPAQEDINLLKRRSIHFVPFQEQTGNRIYTVFLVSKDRLWKIVYPLLAFDPYSAVRESLQPEITN